MFSATGYMVFDFPWLALRVYDLLFKNNTLNSSSFIISGNTEDE
jgi:hypothetical protein